jgi:7-keto-8-aminopelargonate synthetase-like enzyme
MRDEPQRQRRVRELAARVRTAFALAGDSPIVPIVLGEPSAALAAADQLREEGLLVLPVRPPTVPRGTSRLRVTVCSEHTDDEVRHLIEQLRRCRKN